MAIVRLAALFSAECAIIVVVDVAIIAHNRSLSLSLSRLIDHHFQWDSSAKAKIRSLTSANIAKKSSSPNLCVGET